MARAMLINVTQEEESRVAIVEDGRLEWIEIETGSREALKGNIYKGVVENVNTSLQAAFVKFGASRAGFLPFDEVNFRLLPARKRNADKSGTTKKAGAARGQRTRITDHLQPGQEVLVQVVREQLGTKPPTLSTFFSLPGRYLVLLPAGGSGGVSRKIDDEAGRERLKKVLKQLEPGEDNGLIVRTAGINQTKIALTRDLRYLTRLWAQIERAANKVKPPALIFRERDLVLRAIRDLFSPDISEVLIDSEEVYKRAVRYFRSIMPGKQKLVKLYEGDRPLFARHDLEDQIENIYKRRMALPSGGAIVIDETEALTSIDVNSGKTRESSIEETAYRSNLEAATEVARQLRLRDIGGLVVIDFIDMRTSSYTRAVEKRLREAMKQDAARYDMTRISKLGLLEMSRQRMRPTTMSSSYTTCSECEGNGVVKTVESAALSVLRKIHTRSAQGDWARIKVTLPTVVAEYLQNRKREELVRLEQRHRTEIQVRARHEMSSLEALIEVEHRRAVEEEERRGRQAIQPKVEHPEAVEESDSTRRRARRRRSSSRDDENAAKADQADRPTGETDEPATSGTDTRRRRSRTSRARAATAADDAAATPASATDEPAESEASGADESANARPRRRRGRRGGRGRRRATATASSDENGAAADDVGTTDAPVEAAPAGGPTRRPVRSRSRGKRRAADEDAPDPDAPAQPDGPPDVVSGADGEPGLGDRAR